MSRELYEAVATFWRALGASGEGRRVAWSYEDAGDASSTRRCTGFYQGRNEGDLTDLRIDLSGTRARPRDDPGRGDQKRRPDFG